MADKTKNYGLTKPNAEEFYDVNVQNENMDIIDEELKKKYSADNKPEPSDIGASPADHKHTISEITDFPTGMTPNAHKHSADDIDSGTLNSDRLPTVPVTKGGTGATDAATARSNLEITPANIGAAPSQHGNHVPTTGTSDSATFLRNDNTWQKVTPANIGAAPTSHKHTKSEITDFPNTENWTFTLEDGSTVTKAVYVG